MILLYFIGSIIVTVKLVDTDVKTAKEIIPVLAQAIQDGKLDIHGLENQKLKAMASLLDVLSKLVPQENTSSTSR